MHAMQIASIPCERWKNGGGTTRVLASSGDDWRVSLAEVEAHGPYSSFDGQMRTSMIVRGNGVTLRDGERLVTLAPFEVVSYDGATPWRATLVNGPVSSLNVMSRTERYRVHMSVLSSAVSIEAPCTAIVVAFDEGHFAVHDVRSPLRVTPPIENRSDQLCVLITIRG
ncbi:HutD/Ves family protein [Caballeronia hypogeia]|nr:HutD family protein [Caballeronia hypogeia]